MLLKILAIILFQGVLAYDVTPGGRPDSGSVSADLHLYDGTEAKSRAKRCTCYSYKDKECVYYCHLDIIWINTPERTVPYGMSSYRGRRAAGGQPAEPEGGKTQRCICVDADPECHGFCLSSGLQRVPVRSLHKVPRPG
ncbi:hypothetical protein Q5P01_007528 [Channa striata]|uniref:Endothelin-3 n=1 Tax=Channa striata TaxID=64152 RepID=A0AA88N9F9_CHASR|nr:hypothetical protein Q5P01_007528 [Channa striata]